MPALLQVQPRFSMRLLMLFAVLLGMSATVRADIWECVDSSGNKRFTNLKSEAAGCKPMNLPPVSTVPAPKPQAPARVAEPKPQAATPGSFPKVDAPTQQQRDAERRRILEQELANEQKLLDQAKKELAEQEAVRLGSERNYQRVLDRLEPFQKKVALHEGNIANLRKEIGALR
jgi:hypothetical protein